jgi:hypothetical protein
LKAPFLETKLWLAFRICPGRRVSVAHTRLIIREGSSKTKGDGSKDLQWIAFSISGILGPWQAGNGMIESPMHVSANQVLLRVWSPIFSGQIWWL